MAAAESALSPVAALRNRIRNTAATRCHTRREVALRRRVIPSDF